MASASKKAIERAELKDRDCRQLENAAIAVLPALVRNITDDSLQSWQAVQNADRLIEVASQSLYDKLRPMLIDIMVASSLRGQLRVIQTVTEWIKTNRQKKALYSQDSPYVQTIEALKEKLNLTDRKIDNLAKKYDAEALRITNETNKLLRENLRKATSDIISQGMHVKEGKALINQAFINSGFGEQSPWLCETIVRTQTQLAYSAGQWTANNEPAIQEILWGYEYVTVGDDRVRPEHAALEGVRLEKDDPRWNEIFPPNGYNCRCKAIEIYNDEKIATVQDYPDSVEIDGQTIIPGADAGFRFNPGKILS